MKKLIRPVFFTGIILGCATLVCVIAYFINPRETMAIRAAAFLLASSACSNMAYLLLTQGQYKEMRKIHQEFLDRYKMN